ncbi:YqhR family membrane protein [Lederbergia citrea]|uniref:Membrane protein YqhR n=1 Tax=Lederbergia citrea TaxID=2833581 RepID=A0A942UJ23_9BACI|nr:YqhR family membrane protein [Lederbergia citrea]MBS4202932.1 hypothetical protein [Lederbergia citrea]MBS4222396.1 hypothetical protein [Lederbergia citrea]
MENQEKEIAAKTFQMPMIKLSIIIGFFAGTVGSLLGYLAYSFGFTKITPAVILAPWDGSWKDGWLGIAIAAFLYGFISILVALLYYMVFRKQKSLFWGTAFGIGVFALIFIVLQPLIPGAKTLFNYDLNTILTELCFFIIYGTFIGYSISYEYNELLYLKDVKLKH